MKASKTLASAVAAASLVGVIGLAYAQTSIDPAPNGAATGTMQNSTDPTSGVKAGTGTSADQTLNNSAISPADSSLQERNAQADRN